MKPNFALNLTHEAIGLLHRTARGWLTIGEAALDSADLGEALGYLRASALGLAPQGITTKLIIPNSQILYTEVEAPSPDPARRMEQVRAALDGLTPYAVEDLVFDVHGTGPRVQVAVIARETLDEAEGFAVQHRMNPVSFVAIPPEGAFGGEPFFGPTQHAARVLGADEQVERDAEAVSIVTREDGASRPGAPEAGARAARRQRTAAAAAEAGPRDIAEPDAAPPPIPEEAAAAQSETGTPAATPVATITGAAPVPAPPPETALPQAAEGPAADPVPAAPPEAAPPVTEPESADATDAEPTPSAVVAEEAPAALAMPVRRDAAERPVPGPADADVAPETPGTRAAPDVLQPPAFSSRRRDSRATAPLPLQDRVAAEEGLPVGAVTARPDPAPAAAEARPAARREAPPLTVVASSVPGLAGIKAAAGGATTARGVPPTVEGAPPLRSAPRPTLAAVNPPTAAAAPPFAPPPPAPVTPAPATPVPSPPARSRVPANQQPDARGRAAAAVPPTRGKPRFLGLILTGLLLLLLVGVAAWSSLYLSDDEGAAPAATAVASAPGDAATATADLPVAPAPVTPSTDAPAGTAATDLSEADPEFLADLDALGTTAEEATGLATADDSAAPAATEEAAAALAADPGATPAAPVAEAPAPDPAPGPAPQSATAGLGSATPLAGDVGPQDEIFLSGNDSPPPAFDPAALPPPSGRAEVAPDAPLPPPPAGTLYSFDEQGRIRASGTGVVMPGGFWMIEARPPVLPPPRPEALTTAAPEAEAVPVEPASGIAPEATVPAGAASGVVPEATVPVDAAILAARPRSRPQGLTPPADPAAAPATDADDGAAVAVPFAPTEFASPRPRARAGSTVALAGAARLGSGGASLVQTASATTAPQPAADPSADASAAVVLSPRPAPRPVALSRAVEAAVAEAAAVAPEPRVEAPAPEAEALAHAEADAEPEVTSAAPPIPTRANVAKQATLANAVNLSKVNLVGIFGTPSNRYAWVRMASSRMTRVEVGDRVDGGVVTAIGASELRYQKGGKVMTLTMPRG